MIEKLKSFWDTCDTTFAHLTIDKHLKHYDNLTNNWDKYFLTYLNNLYSLENKNIIDYGIGGGYLGIHLHKKYHIKKYIGIDLSNRQLKYAEYNLKQYPIDYELLITPIEFNTIPCDIFISQAVIQHFPDREYLNDFLHNINYSNIPIIMLQIRHNKNTIFSNGEYNSIKEVVHRCHTNNDYIQSYLNNYINVYKGSILLNQYQFLLYQAKNI